MLKKEDRDKMELLLEKVVRETAAITLQTPMLYPEGGGKNRPGALLDFQLENYINEIKQELRKED